MQKKYYKVIVLMAFVLILCFNSLTVMADDKEPAYTFETYINPRYADIVNPEDIVVPPEPVTPEPLDSVELYAVNYSSLADARDYLVKCFAERASEITFSSSHLYNLADIIKQMEKHTGNPIGGDYLAWSYYYVTAYVSTGNNYTYYLYFDYYSTAAQEKELNEEISRVMNGELNLYGMTQYQKVISIYDYICQNISFDYDRLENDSYLLKYTAYAALVNKTAVCQGYATLFYRMCLMKGIDARCIVNDDHAWNIVRIDDKYYNVDATWDSENYYYDYCLKCNANFPDHERDSEYNTAEFNRLYPMSENDHPLGYDWSLDNGVLTVNGPGVLAGDSPWSGNADIKKVVLNKVRQVDAGAFLGCENLSEFTADGTLEEIRVLAFEQCTGLKKITIPRNVKIIDVGAFSECTALESVEFPNGIKKLGFGAFAGCTSLKEITIPKGVKVIEGLLFGDCSSLERINFHEEIEGIDIGAFKGCTSLKRITIPNSVKTIGEHAFRECEALEEIVLPEGIEEIGANTFQGCKELKYVYIPNNVKTIGDSAFSGCEKLRNVVLPAGVVKIGSGAFNMCNSLEQVYIPRSAIEIASDAFSSSAPRPTIYGYYDSYAQYYAFQNGLAFFAIDYIPGDINGDGNLSGTDMDDILRSIKGTDILTESQKNAADFYGSDGVVDIRDFCAIYNFTCGAF